MSALTKLWNNYTLEFSTAQKVIVAIVLGAIVIIAFTAIVLVILEFTK
ncbi:hypothetical protein [Salinimicrobium gaetbulicola]|uniref:Uncharacterized protein n=1 Tax=Salinimicrobium gaetbulicola TaxID=999702 RepID=A0ABW3ICT4_9FLAO